MRVHNGWLTVFRGLYLCWIDKVYFQPSWNWICLPWFFPAFFPWGVESSGHLSIIWRSDTVLCEPGKNGFGMEVMLKNLPEDEPSKLRPARQMGGSQWDPWRREVSLFWNLAYNWWAVNMVQWAKKLAAKPDTWVRSPGPMQWKKKKPMLLILQK